MWEVVTSQGHRARGIQHESDAHDTVYSLGLATLVAPGRYLVADNRGERFVAEVHPQPNTKPIRHSSPPYRRSQVTAYCHEALA